MKETDITDIFKLDVGRTAISMNANLLIVYNNKKMFLYHEQLQEIAEEFEEPISLGLLSCTCDKVGDACDKPQNNSFSFIARDISCEEALKGH